MTTGRRKLAELFGAWMDRNGYTQTDIAAMGGPSTTTQSKVRLTDDSISRQTLRQLDAVMGWAPGTAGRIIQGLEEGDPTHGGYPEGVPDPDAETVGTSEDTGDLLFARPDGLTDEQWNQVKIDAGELVGWLIEKAARERQGK